MIIKTPILLPRQWFMPTVEPQIHVLEYEPTSPGIYRCMDCARANLDWLGSAEEIQGHSEMHALMAQWFHHTFLPGFRSSKN